MSFSIFHLVETKGELQIDKTGVAFLLALLRVVARKGHRQSDISSAIASLLDGRDRPKK